MHFSCICLKQIEMYLNIYIHMFFLGCFLGFLKKQQQQQQINKKKYMIAVHPQNTNKDTLSDIGKDKTVKNSLLILTGLVEQDCIQRLSCFSHVEVLCWRSFSALP